MTDTTDALNELNEIMYSMITHGLCHMGYSSGCGCGIIHDCLHWCTLHRALFSEANQRNVMLYGRSQIVDMYGIKVVVTPPW